jgi:transcriptional regulator with XRE-family HTH domain
VNTISVKEGLAEKFKNKEYRDAFVAEQIFSRLPLKIRSIREDQELTQRQLGELADMAQTWVSKLEDPNYGKLTISTLLKLASAFDVGLHIDFVPFSKVLDGAMRLRSESFCVLKFADDKGFLYSPGILGGASIAYITEGISGGKLFEFPLQDTLGSVESAMTPPASASSLANQQLAA